eukprot:7400366-Alexandrium_andersonii.AAC.1
MHWLSWHRVDNQWHAPAQGFPKEPSSTPTLRNVLYDGIVDAELDRLGSQGLPRPICQNSSTPRAASFPRRCACC